MSEVGSSRLIVPVILAITDSIVVGSRLYSLGQRFFKSGRCSGTGRKVDGAHLCVNMGFGIRSRPTTPLIPAPKLEEMGVDAVIYPRLITAAAMMGMKNALEELQKAVTTSEKTDRPDPAVGWDYYTKLIG